MAQQHVVLTLESVHCYSTEDTGWLGSEDEFYVLGTCIAGGQTIGIMTDPVSIDNGQSMQLSKRIFDGMLDDEQRINLAIAAFDEDSGKDWQARQQVIDSIQGKVSDRIKQMPKEQAGEIVIDNPTNKDQPFTISAEELWNAVVDAAQWIASLDADDKLGQFVQTWKVSEVPPRLHGNQRIATWSFQQGNASYDLSYSITVDPPAMLVDADFYLGLYPDMRAAFGTDRAAAARHWVEQGIVEGRRGSREFDVRFYLDTYSDLLKAFGADYPRAVDHWVKRGLPVEGRRASREFDVRDYVGRYQDLRKAFGGDYTRAIDHWINRGLPLEGRRGSPDFDVRFYLAQYEDLRRAFGDDYTRAIDHWIRTGSSEGRKGDGA
jgi:hypothetical protein